MKTIILIVCFVFSINALAQDTLRITSYDIFRFSEDSYADRIDDFRMILSEINTDILVVQEMATQGGLTIFQDSVLNYSQNNFQAAPFVDESGYNNALFFRNEKFNFISNRQIPTRNLSISEYKLNYIHDPNQTDLWIYSTHFSPNRDSTGRTERTHEADSLRKELNKLPPNSNFFVAGGLNIYKSGEFAYYNLISDENPNGQCNDPIDAPGYWYNNKDFASIHTQSTHAEAGGGFAYGGMDDRYDIILVSNALLDSNEYFCLKDTYQAFGNNGKQFNKSINEGRDEPIADALYNASDNLPVVMDFIFLGGTIVPVSLSNFVATVDQNMVRLTWRTISETNNLGFSIERLSDSDSWQDIAFIAGNGTCSVVHEYMYIDRNLSPGQYSYRLKQIDYDGQSSYSKVIQTQINPIKTFSLNNAYPNPFNSSTMISFTLSETSEIRLIIYDIRGREVEMIEEGLLKAGAHQLKFDARDLVSGVYFVKLECSEFKSMKKIILLK